MTPAALARVDAEVERLLAHGFLSMAFQPIVEVSSLRRAGFEALLRGPRETALAHPGTLFGRGRPLSSEVLRQLDLACVDAALRSGRALPKGSLLFINIQAGTMSLDGRELFSLMDALEVEPQSVVLEISESFDGEHTKEIGRHLLPFRRRGVMLALDDVGVRYPWLYHLLHLEPEWIKIDRSFVKDVHRSARRADLLRGLGELAARLGARVIAEGIETEGDAEALRGLGIRYAQGFRFGRPAPAETWLDGASRKSLWKRPVEALHVTRRPARERKPGGC